LAAGSAGTVSHVAGSAEAQLGQLTREEQLVANNMMKDFPASVEGGLAKADASVASHAGNMKSGFSNLGSNVTGAMGTMGLAIGALGAGMAIKSFTDTGQAAYEMSEKLGIS